MVRELRSVHPHPIRTQRVPAQQKLDPKADGCQLKANCCNRFPTGYSTAVPKFPTGSVGPTPSDILKLLEPSGCLGSNPRERIDSRSRTSLYVAGSREYEARLSTPVKRDFASGAL